MDTKQELTDKDPDELANKDLLDKVKAAVTVFKHTNNRIPTLEEVSELLKQDPKQELQKEEPAPLEPPSTPEEEANTPKCLSMIVLHGKDPSKPAFFSDPSSKSHFDVSSGEWLNELPDLAQHLTQRDVQGDDIFSMIIHGIMDDDDYAKLDQAGMIDDKSAALKTKIDSMRDAHNSLEKSINEFTGDSRPEANMDFEDQEGDALSTFGMMSDTIDDEADMPGENVLAQIFDGAVSAGTCPKIVKMVNEQIAKALGKPVDQLFPAQEPLMKEPEDTPVEPVEKTQPSPEPKKSAKVAILN